MRPVEGGTQKLTMNSKELDYQQMLRQSKAQADGNPYVAGVQQVFMEGAGNAVKGSTSAIGDQPLKPQELLQGTQSNFQAKDAPANSPLDDPYNQTGSVDLEMSATRNPNRDPEDLATKQLDERLQMYAKAGSNAGFGNNNRAQTMRLN